MNEEIAALRHRAFAVKLALRSLVASHAVNDVEGIYSLAKPMGMPAKAAAVK